MVGSERWWTEGAKGRRDGVRSISERGRMLTAVNGGARETGKEGRRGKALNVDRRH